jgi:hypothetical protein
MASTPKLLNHSRPMASVTGHPKEQRRRSPRRGLTVGTSAPGSFAIDGMLGQREISLRRGRGPGPAATGHGAAAHWDHSGDSRYTGWRREAHGLVKGSVPEPSPRRAAGLNMSPCAWWMGHAGLNMSPCARWDPRRDYVRNQNTWIIRSGESNGLQMSAGDTNQHPSSF